LDRLRAREIWDVLIVGGGATGLGAAVDAASRGYRTVLVEARDFGSGTSSRSTKLIHGGVRYLAQGNLKLVREALRERGLILQNAPHLATPLDFIIPVYRRKDRLLYGLGLKAYDRLAGKLSLGPTRILTRRQVLDAAAIQSDGLIGGVVYRDLQFDDARMAISLLRTFLSLGGVAANYMPVTWMEHEAGRLLTVFARDEETGEEFQITARAFINATGVFADEIRRMDQPDAEPMLSPSQGTHIVLPRSFLPGGSAVMVPKTDDGRVIFAVPWQGRTLVGTTDVPVGAATMEPRALPEEVKFLLVHANRYLSSHILERDVLAVFSGLRPLVKDPKGHRGAALSRDHTVVVSPSGLVTVTGGKWTTYRLMAEDAVNQAVEVAGLEKRPCLTASLRLKDDEDKDEFLAGYSAATSGWPTNLPYRVGDILWAARHEMARTVEDILARRTRALLLDAKASQESAPFVAQILAEELGFGDSWQASQIQRYRSLAATYQLPQ
jgi:glycerol-3-phosphate dehydrogenase